MTEQHQDGRQRAIELLEANHTFPGDYRFQVIALGTEAVSAAVLAAAGVGPEADDTRASSAGKYLSHRVTVHVASAVEVLDLYARLRAVEGVVTVL